MQTTLLSFAIGLILALLAALVVPHFIRWNDHRAFFEAEASRLVGVKVKVGGDIDAVLLPTPSVTLRAIAIGPAGQGSRLRARSLHIELALGPLMQGEFRATEMRMVAPQINLGLDEQGEINWPPVTLAHETLSIDRLTIENGHATLTDANSKSALELDQIWFSGEVRSLTGPLRGKGEFVAAGGLYGYDISVGRGGPDGARVRLSLKTDERPLTVEADGMMALTGGSPRFDGTLALSRPAGAVLATGKAAAYEPWRLTSKIKSDTASALFDEVAFQYGPDERAATLTGSAEFKFGAHPQLRGALSARQIDLDRLLATPQAPRHLPFAAVQAFGDMLGSALRPPWPVRLSLGVDALTVGGANVQNVSSELHSDGQSWALDQLELRAPGFTQVKVTGKLYPLDKSLGFAGSANIDSNDPKNLVAWLAGRSAGAAQFRPWRIKGDVTLGADRIAVENLRTEFDRGSAEGSVSYAWSSGNRPARLDGSLRAAELDLDSVTGFGQSALEGLGLERPGEVSLAIEVGRARIAGLDARELAARLTLDANGLAIERFSIADVGDTSVAASGRIQTSSSPGGSITVDIDSRDLGGMVAVAENFLPPGAVDAMRRLAARQKTAVLRAAISLADIGNNRVNGKLDLSGQLGAIRVTVAASADGKRESFKPTDLGALFGTDVHIDSRLESTGAAPLLALLGLDRNMAADDRPARLDVTVNGPLSRELPLTAKLTAGRIDVAGRGAFRTASDQPASLDLAQFAGTLGDSKVQGRLALRFGDAPQAEGSVETDTFDAPAVIVAAIGGSAVLKGTTWSTEPIGWNPLGFIGRIDFKARQGALLPGLVAHDLHGVARFGASEVVFEGVVGQLARGKLDGRLAISNGADGVSTRLRIGLNDAEAGALFNDAEHPPVSGRLMFQTELEGSGRSPAAFMGSLTGFGSISLEHGQFAGLNPQVFGAITRAVELGVPLDGDRLRRFVAGALDNAGLPTAQASAAISISAGQARLRDIKISAEGAELSATANVDLSDATLDAMLTLDSLPSAANATRPAVLIALKGPLPAPKRNIDISLLSSWLTLRAVEQQSKQIDAMERARREAAAAAAGASEAAEKPPAPPPGPAATETAPAAPDAANQRSQGNAAPALPPPITVPAAPKPRATPRADNIAPPRAAPPPASLGAQN